MDEKRAGMLIFLEFLGDRMIAEAHLQFPRNTTQKKLTFLLNNGFEIEEVRGNHEKLFYVKKGEVHPQGRIASQLIEVESKTPIQKITVVYRGNKEAVTYWHNIITDTIKSLSWYSVWYPQDTSMPMETDRVIVKNAEDYFLVKGLYHEDEKTWEYGGKGYDAYNLMLYRRDRLKISSNPYMNIYYTDDSIQPQIDLANEVYQRVVEFYNGKLFPKVDIPVLDVACTFPAFHSGGGYRRKDFMWCITLGESPLDMMWLFAHETAHIWCSGADCASWEDWLNETTAEWASLLFALHENNEELFQFILQPKISRCPELPAIKTADGSRPEGVHDKGTVLFYEIYQKYGEDAIYDIVKTFSQLKDKTTESLLNELCLHGRFEVAKIIRARLTAE